MDLVDGFWGKVTLMLVIINSLLFYTCVNYEYGIGFKKNKSEAKKWYEKAYEGASSSKNKRMIKKRIKNLWYKI